MDMLEAGAPPAAHADVFGDEESDDEVQLQPTAPAAPAEVPAEPAATSPVSGGDKRSKLQQLAEKKRKEQEEAAREAEKHARKKRKRQAEAAAADASLEDTMAQQQPAAAPEAHAGAGTAAVPAEDLFGDNEDSDEERPVARTAADDAFIDDTGAVPDDRYNSDQEQMQDLGPEAEEGSSEDELNNLGKARRKARGGQVDVRMLVTGFLSKMEAAAEADAEANKRKRPAVAKLGLLKELQAVFSNRQVHADFIDAGLLGVLKAWIELLPDGSLPNAAVRSAVLKLLQQLNVDISMEGRRQQLKKSSLGRVVMFLYKLPSETPDNRRMAKDLVFKWSRLIFEEYRDHDADSLRRDREAQIARQRQARQAAGAGADDEEPQGAKPELKPGDKGFRWHANVPEPAKLDYTRQPQSKVSVDAASIGKPVKKNAIFRKLQNKKKKGQAASVSVQGRELHL